MESKRSTAVLLTLLLTLLLAAAPAAQDALAIEHVRVLPMDTERVLEDQTLVIEGEFIRWMGPAGEAEVPEGAKRVDGRGKTLIPGLIDMHLHLLSEQRIADSLAAVEMKVLVANGLTTVRLTAGKPQYLELRVQTLVEELEAPWLYVASPMLTGRSFGRVFTGRVTTSSDAARAAVREFGAAGYDYIKLSFGIRPIVYLAVIEEAKKQGLRVIGHVSPDVGLEAALNSGQQIEHLDQFLEWLMPEDVPNSEGPSGLGAWRRSNWDNIDLVDENRIPALAKRVAAADIYLTPTMVLQKSAFGKGRTDAEIDASPDMRFVSDEVKENLLGGRASFEGNQPARAHRDRYHELRNALVKALYDEGVPLMAGTDSPEWALLGGFTLHRELQCMVDAGIPAWGALATATRNPARWLGGADEFGTIAQGMRADLVLLGADPLEDIANTTKIEGVVLRGRWLGPKRIEKMLDDAAATLSAAVLRPSVRPR